MILFKGKKQGMVHTINITLDDIRAVFFPKNFHEKYKYLGSVPWEIKGSMSKAIEPLVIFLDYKARPNWCPRWFLRFLCLFGNDNSIVRVRNQRLHKLFRKLTKGYMIWDYKTKWSDYDLRISITGDEQCQDLSSAIQSKFYRDGLRQDIYERILEIDPNTKLKPHSTLEDLKEEIERLEEHQAV